MFARVCREADIVEGEVYRFDVGNNPLLVTRNEGKIIITQAICTHEEADLTLGILTSGNITCPLHQATFNLTSGQVISGPNGEDTESINPLRVFHSKVENGDLLADL